MARLGVRALTEVRESRSREITRQYSQLRDSLVIYTRGSTAIEAVNAFEAGFDELDAADLSSELRELVNRFAYEDALLIDPTATWSTRPTRVSTSAPTCSTDRSAGQASALRVSRVVFREPRR